MLRRIGTVLSLVSTALLISGCDGAPKPDPAAAELAEKGYATRGGQIIRVAEPDGPLIKSNQQFLPGEFVLQGYDETMRPEFTDRVRVLQGDTPSKLVNKALMMMLQERMKIDHGSPSFKASDYPCRTESVQHKSDGSFAAKGDCRIVSRKITQSFTYSGQTHEDGFKIDVVRVTTGDTPESGEKRIRILAHLVTASDPQ